MKAYRGYYIDKRFFNSKEDIDNFIKDNTIAMYKKACKIFIYSKDIGSSVLMDEYEQKLNEQCGLSWEEIEAIQIETFKNN